MDNNLSLLSDYYDKVYVISVRAAEDRRDRFKQNFAGLDFSFFFGADKNNFSVKDLVEKNIYNEELARKHHRYTKSMMPGEIACAWSHRMIYEEMIKNNYSRVLIFEDDALPDTNNLSRVPQILAEMPPDCELMMWGWAKNAEPSYFKKFNYHFLHAIRLLKWDHTVINNLFAKSFSSHLKKAGFHDYAHAYGITRGCAEKFLQMQTPIQYIADNLLAHAVTQEIVTGYIAYPPVILHDNLPDGTGRDSYIR